MKNWKVRLLDWLPIVVFTWYALVVIPARNWYIGLLLGHEVQIGSVVFLLAWLIGVFVFMGLRSQARKKTFKHKPERWYQIGPVKLNKLEVLVLLLLILAVEILLILVWVHANGQRMWLLEGAFALTVFVLLGYVGEAQLAVFSDIAEMMKSHIS